MMCKRFTLLFTGTILLVLGINCQDNHPQQSPIPPPFITTPTPWADSVITTLSLEEKIGQLFMIPAYSKGNKNEDAVLLKTIEKYDVGGVIFMQGGPVRQAQLTNKIQQQSKIPVMVAMDAEWGLGMRLDSTISYPWQMALGASRNKDLVYQFGVEMSRQLKRLGVQISFSPVVDVNNNPENPVINARSFGEDVALVSQLGMAYMNGLQDHHVLACAKHFPGHGDTKVDSHKDLPIISHDISRLTSIEHKPFENLIQHGLGSMMVAHLYIPALDSTPNLASTLSPIIVKELLQNQMGFEGLIFTDALTMKGVTKFHDDGDLEVLALAAGNDVLLFPTNLETAREKIIQAIQDSVLTEADITLKCHKILRVKEWTGVHQFQNISTDNMVEDLNNPGARALHHELSEQSITLVKNEGKLLPIHSVAQKKIAVLTVGKEKGGSFIREFSEQVDCDEFTMVENPDFSTSKKIISQLKEYDLVIVNMLTASRKVSKNYGLNQQTVLVANTLAQNSKVVFCAFNNPYALGRLQTEIRTQAILIAYHDDNVAQISVARALLGGFEMHGKLPVTVGSEYPFGHGLQSEKLNIMYDVIPEELGIHSEDLSGIDSIAWEGIEAQAFPGCRILAAKGGKVFYDKSFGYFTFEEKKKVDENTLYDLASITKIVASTLSMMKLQDEGKVDVNYNLCDYLPINDTSEYYNINLMEMLSHTARLQSWIPFYLNTLDDGKLKKDIYSSKRKAGFNTEVADDLYICDSYVDSIYLTILNTSLRKKREYKYSDLGYYFIKTLIEKKTGKPLEVFVDSAFYSPLHLRTIGYLPLNRFSADRIAPTEYDMKFRKQLICGHVHDPGAAMMGGVGGHAGVFSNASDLAKIMQMLLGDGRYGGSQIIDSATVAYFTSCHYCDQDNRRGIGFDKPSMELDAGPTCDSASPQSFGHSGFTGTLAWADPEQNIVYVFLSNRIYPNADNLKLLKMDIRTRIQQVIYNTMNIPARYVKDDPPNY